ncbi:hypothetical protein [Microvirus mar54]|uniref:Uncharacterized protein n=1 Tax=Microvirus mar54 TaxID=2851190 RepID=A0A8F6AI54_9VIRU|nr:hypothetical protein [Microvirus mar54]
MIATIKQRARKTRAYNQPLTYVESGLAMTPSEMLRASNMGVPISTQMLSGEMFVDGEVSELTDVPIEFRRGVDISDIQEYQENSRKNMHKAYQIFQQSTGHK